ncbi:hypothetical protein ABT052_47370 [Streptomyces sp. NPDC002766]|uniref:hypothetical protein n=1 Tax=Streptomyces sp. NPDC002766 TaxID=3154429 RepID=UPI003320DCD1
MAEELRVSVRSVQRWHQAWEHGDRSALESTGPAPQAQSRVRLSLRCSRRSCPRGRWRMAGRTRRGR